MIQKNAMTKTAAKITGKHAIKAMQNASVNFIFYRSLLATLPSLTQKNNATFF
jgi:hypothetical protein